MSRHRFSTENLDPAFPEGRELIHHLTSQIVMNQPLITEEARDEFVRQMKVGSKFCGVKILAYVIMPDHFHLLIAVPAPQATSLDEKEFFRRVGPTLSRSALAELRADWKSASAKMKLEIQRPFQDRMNSLPKFMKNLVHRITTFINRERGRRGSLWQSRFRSAIIEEGFTARAVSAYFHANPVRAGLVTDPGDYRWSSFTKARKADRALAMQASLVSLKKRDPLPRLAVKSLEAAIAELNPKFNDEDLALAQALSETVRHFTDGSIVGSADFVNRIFEANRDFFSEGRETGARVPMGPLKVLKGKIQSVRALQRGVFER